MKTFDDKSKRNKNDRRCTRKKPPFEKFVAVSDEEKKFKCALLSRERMNTRLED